jgi:fucose 4-O-acetylase-like acetyltransferase
LVLSWKQYLKNKFTGCAMTASLKKWLTRAFNLNIIDAKRHAWVDYLRGIVIILVVYHHVFLGMVKNGIPVPKSILDANMAAYSFRMPLFFIFSGIFTGLNLSSKSVKKIAWKKFNVLFYPYIIWSIIQITLQIIFSDYTNSVSSYRHYLYILYQPKGLAHFWYLPALFNSTMVFVLIKRFLKIKTYPHLLLGLLFFLLAPFVNSISMMSNWMRFYIFLAIGDAIASFILKREVQEQLKRPAYFLAFIPIFIIAQFYYFNIIGVRPLENDSATFNINYITYFFREISFLTISLIGCTTFILLSFLVEKWNRWKWLRIVGFHSLYIYILHVIVVGFVRIIFLKLLGVQNYLVVLLAAIVFGIIIPIVFYNLVGRKYLWFLFSMERGTTENSKLKESNIRTSDLRIPPLHPTVKNI